MKSKTVIKEFGKRLAVLRKARGFTQEELGKRIGLTRRVIVYYESESKYPPTHLLVPLAKALKVNIEELLGLKKSDLITAAGSDAALWRRLKKVESLSKSDQKALLKMIDGLVAKSKK